MYPYPERRPLHAPLSEDPVRYPHSLSVASVGPAREGCVAIVWLIVLLNEISCVDFFFPETALEAIPLDRNCTWFSSFYLSSVYIE